MRLRWGWIDKRPRIGGGGVHRWLHGGLLLGWIGGFAAFWRSAPRAVNGFAQLVVEATLLPSVWRPRQPCHLVQAVFHWGGGSAVLGADCGQQGHGRMKRCLFMAPRPRCVQGLGRGPAAARPPLRCAGILPL